MYDTSCCQAALPVDYVSPCGLTNSIGEKIFWLIYLLETKSFVMNGEVNTQNVRQYAPKGHPPTFNFEKSNSREHLTVWAALCGIGMIFGPYFFERNVNGITYLRMFNEFVFPQLVEHFNNQH